MLLWLLGLSHIRPRWVVCVNAVEDVEIRGIHLTMCFLAVKFYQASYGILRCRCGSKPGQGQTMAQDQQIAVRNKPVFTFLNVTVFPWMIQ